MDIRTLWRDIRFLKLLAQLIFIVVLVVVRRLSRPLRSENSREGYATAWRQLRLGILANPRLASLLVVAVVLPVVIACFTGWKVWLNARVPFTWDVRLALWDRQLHGGRLPSDWLLTAANTP